MSTSPILGKRARDEQEDTTELESDSKKQKVDETQTYEGKYLNLTYSLKDEPAHSLENEPSSNKRLATLQVSGVSKFAGTWSFHYVSNQAFDWSRYFKKELSRLLCRFWFRYMSNVEQLKEVPITKSYREDAPRHTEDVVTVTIELDNEDVFAIKILTKHRTTGQETLFRNTQRCSPWGGRYFTDCSVCDRDYTNPKDRDHSILLLDDCLKQLVNLQESKC